MEPTIIPTARRLAEENGLDWRKIKGSGVRGEIGEADVLDYLMRVMSGEEDLPEGSVDPIPATLEQDMAAMRSMIAGSGMADEGELDALMAQSAPPAPSAPQASFEVEEPEPVRAAAPHPEVQPLEAPSPVVEEALDADDFDFDMEDPLAASAEAPLPAYETPAFHVEPEPLAAAPAAALEQVQGAASELDASAVSALSDEDFAALMGEPIPGLDGELDTAPQPAGSAPSFEHAPEPLAAASTHEHEALHDDFAASSAPSMHEPVSHQEPLAAAVHEDAPEEVFAPAPVQDIHYSEPELEAVPAALAAAPAMEERPHLESDYAGLAGPPVLNADAPISESGPAPLAEVALAGAAAAAAGVAASSHIPAPTKAVVPAPTLVAPLSLISLRVQFDVSALQEAASQLEPLVGPVGMGFFLARAVNRHAHLLGQQGVSHFRLEDSSFAPLHNVGGEFRAALEDFSTAPVGQPVGIAVAYAGALGLEEASSGQAAFSVSLGKPFGELTGLTLRGDTSVATGAAFLSAVADSLHKPITLLV